MAMDSSTSPEASMKALMDVVSQVVSGKSNPPGFLFAQPTNPIPGSGGVIAPHPAPSYPFAVCGVPAGHHHGGPLRKRNHESAVTGDEAVAIVGVTKKAKIGAAHDDDVKRSKRLEQNRMAAIESRRRKKHMVEELQRSVQFYSKANVTLKGQNVELERQLLVAKEKVQTIKAQKAKSKGIVDDFASADKDGHAIPDSKPEAKNSAQSAAILGLTPNAEMERQAQQAQFAATQALYKTMGYPSGAARAAASALSQYVGQAGAPVPSLPPMVSGGDAVTGQSRAPAVITVAAPRVALQAAGSTTTALSPPAANKSHHPDSEDSTYIQALNRFAMQQAAAANAAAAAANAAIHAAHLHNQLRNTGVGAAPPSSMQAVRSIPFPFPGQLKGPIPGPALSSHLEVMPFPFPDELKGLIPGQTPSLPQEVPSLAYSFPAPGLAAWPFQDQGYSARRS